MNEFELKGFDDPDQVVHFPKGKFEIITVGGRVYGRATYEPGWKWSRDVGADLGQAYCTVEHLGMVLSGCATAARASSANGSSDPSMA